MNIVELPTSQGSLLVTLNDASAPPGYARVRWSGASELDLGLVARDRFPGRLLEWVRGEIEHDRTYSLSDRVVGWIVSLSPHRHVLYGSVARRPLELVIADALTSPVTTLIETEVDEQAADRWREALGRC